MNENAPEGDTSGEDGEPVTSDSANPSEDRASRADVPKYDGQWAALRDSETEETDS